MKSIVFAMALVGALGLATAQASEPFVSHFTIGAVEGEWNDVFLPSGVLKEVLQPFPFAVKGL